MTQKTTQLNRERVLALRGLRLPQKALKSLWAYGILAEPAISIHWQKAADRYLIRARESGGAVRDIGAYCGFASDPSEPPPLLEETDTPGRNGFHVLVLAVAIVRVQVFRYQRTYDLLITDHRLLPRPGEKRPLLHNTLLFHGVRGAFAGSEHASADGEPLPVFDDGSGNPARVPKKFEETAAQAILGSHCIGCNHSHVITQGKIVA